MAHVAGRAPRLRTTAAAHPVLCAGAFCLALAAISLALPWTPSYDPWAWIVFGREIVDPNLQFSTLAHTGWKPLPVLFTTPFGLLGAAAPSLWLLVPRAAGIAALGLAFRLGARSGGIAAGLIGAVALLLSAEWLRYFSAGNVEPLAVALLLGAVELHLGGRRGWAFALGALTGLARPEIWPLLGVYALYLWVFERRRWPMLLGLPAIVALWVLPDWAGSGELFHTFHSATISGEPTEILHTSFPAATLSGRALGILVAPVWIAALIAAVQGWRERERVTLTLTVVALSWLVVTIGGEAVGYPAVPRYLVEPAAVCCVLAGIGFAALPRLAPSRARAAVIVVLVVASLPFAVARSIGLGDQVGAATGRAHDLTQLLRTVDRARAQVPVARLHPLIAPNNNATALAWKLHVKIYGVAQNPSRKVGIAFVKGNPPELTALRRMGAGFAPLAADGRWSALSVRWDRTQPFAG
jgi:hypothetical protein